jgi:hypothetical protein
MNPTEARDRVTTLASEVAKNPGRAAALAAEMEELGRIIQGSPETSIPIEPPINRSMCVAHDRVCKSHQVCNNHPKKLDQAAV